MKLKTDDRVKMYQEKDCKNEKSSKGWYSVRKG